MDWLMFCARNRVALTPQQVWAMHWLTMRGKRFLIDFGYCNATELADQDVIVYYGVSFEESN